MKRGELTKIIAQQLDPRHVVICGLGSTMFAWQQTRSTNPTYYATDPMGLASGLALGFALARPDREVVLLQGDGDLAMNLGILLPIAGSAPENLKAFVFQNRRYETGGSQPLPAGSQIQAHILARGAGIARSHYLPPQTTTAQTRQAIDELLNASAVGLLVVDIDAEHAPYGGPGRRSGAEERTEFQRLLESG